jgi:hypothetical protein
MNTSTPKSPDEKPVSALHPWGKYLPSKRIRIVIILIIIISILYAVKNPIISLFKNGTNRVVENIVDVPTPQISQEQKNLSIDKDTDGDGLPDWQEVLIGTDPTISTPQSDIPKEILQLVNTAENSVITADDKLALNVYRRLGTDPKGTNILEAVQAATAKEILDLADSIDKNLTTYTAADINLVDDQNFNQDAYFTRIKKIKSDITPSEDTQQKIYTLLTNGKSEIAITTYQIKVQGIMKALLELPVSVRTSDIHLGIINSLAHINGILSNNYSSVDSTTLYASLLVYQKNKNVFDQLSSF